MRKIRFFMIVALMAISNVMFAQFTNVSNGGSLAGLDSWKAFVIEYNNIDMAGEANAFTVGINKANSLSSSSSLFYEYGLNLQYAFDDSDGFKFNMLTARVPLNLLYAFEVDNNAFIAPFVGLPLNFHIMAKGKDKDWDESWNYFDSDDMDGKEWNRFQIGWNIGLKALIGNKFIGTISYGSSINDLSDNGGEVDVFSVGVGFRF